MRYVRLCALLLVYGAAVSSGCRNLARPPWLAPGPSDYQRSNAVVHDPYPDTHHGPEALGTRPRDYDNPPSDSQRYPLRGGPAAAGPAW